MITLHYLVDSRAQRILWMLEELGLEYELAVYQRDPKTQLAPESLKEVHPLGKSPVLSDGDKVIAESGAIVEYLAQRYGSEAWQVGADDPSYLDYIHWLHFAEGSLMPTFVMKRVHSVVLNQPMPFFVKPIARKIMQRLDDSFVAPNITNNLRYVEGHLSNHDWFAGNRLTAADIQMSFPLEASRSRRPEGLQLPAIDTWVDKIHQRPAYQRALKRGGDYAYAL